jgi:hypothetical protein
MIDFTHRGKATIVRKLARSLPLSILGLVLFGCAALPVLPVPAGGNDTLLVILTGEKRDVKSSYLYTMELQLDDMDKPVIIRPWEKYILISGLAPGNHTSLTLTILPYQGDASWYTTNEKKPVPQSFSVPFVMKAGTCTIFPAKFFYTFEVDPNDGRGRVGFGPRPISPEERQKEIEGMKILKNFALWQID